jgi:hypothetical protein
VGTIGERSQARVLETYDHYVRRDQREVVDLDRNG